jgi:exopolysaccharide biosynthesis polyprenyl glycosylphosphotransferase
MHLASADPARSSTISALTRWANPRRVVLGLDLAALVFVYGAAATLAPNDAGVTLLGIPVWVGALSAYRCYASRRVVRIMDEGKRVLRAALAATVVLAALNYLTGATAPREWVLWFCMASTVGVLSARLVARSVLSTARQNGLWLRKVVLVGANDEGVELRRMLQQDRYLGYEVAGVVDGGANGLGARVNDALESSGAGGVIIAATAMDMAGTNHLIRDLTDRGIHVELTSSLLDVSPDRLTVRPLGRFPVVYIEPTLRHGWRALAKRSFDVTVALTTAVLTAPIWITAAIAVRLDSPGPVIFSQVRVGRNGELFRVHKFRSMVVDAEARLAELRSKNEADGPLFKMAADPRVTRSGRIIRATSIDELPQLWNVIKGEMSLIGPRPALPAEAEQWEGRLHERLRVRPGLTGRWQVHGRSSASFDDYARLDLYYVDNWSLTQDLAILARTIPAVLKRKGAH